MTEVIDPGREGAVKSSPQLVLTVTLGVAVTTAASIEGWHPNRVGLLVLVVVPLIAGVLLDRRTAVGLAAACAVLAFVLPGSLWATSTIHFVRLSAVAAACAASAAAAFWRERLTTTRGLYEGVGISARDCLLRGWRQPLTYGPREASRGPAQPDENHEHTVSLVEAARFDGEALDIALEQNDLERAQWLARGLLGTWVEVVNLLGSQHHP